MSSNNNTAESYSKLSSMVQGKFSEILISKVLIKPGDYCLDIECGTGNVTAILVNKVGPSGQVVGVDQDRERTKIAQKKYSYENTKFLEGKLHEIDLVESSFDLVFINIVYQWLNEYERRKTTRKVFSVLKPNGLFLLAIPKSMCKTLKQCFLIFQMKDCSILLIWFRIHLRNIIDICLQIQVLKRFHLELRQRRQHLCLFNHILNGWTQVMI